MALNLIMLGAPGAGKGTQGERFARARGIPKISTGDILREAVHLGSEIAPRVKEVMDRGELVGDDVMIGIVRDRLERPDAIGGFVLDGFPRTVAQAEALDAMMDGRGPLIIVDVVVPEREILRRLGSRLICEDCGVNAGGFDASDAAAVEKAARPADADGQAAASARALADSLRCRRCGGRLVQRTDDNLKVVMDRLEVYRRATKPLVDHYSKRPTFRSINGGQSLDRVAADLAAAVEAASDSVRGGLTR